VGALVVPFVGEVVGAVVLTLVGDGVGSLVVVSDGEGVGTLAVSFVGEGVGTLVFTFVAEGVGLLFVTVVGILADVIFGVAKFIDGNGDGLLEFDGLGVGAASAADGMANRNTTSNSMFLIFKDQRTFSSCQKGRLMRVLFLVV
jgi:hypothetical protein